MLFIIFSLIWDVDAKSLCDATLNTMKSLGLKCTFLAQCYGGASLMSGHVTEVQTRFREVHKSAVYVHCHAHRLHLVIVDVRSTWTVDHP